MWSWETMNSHVYFPLLLSALNIFSPEVLLIIWNIMKYNASIKNRKLINHIINNRCWALAQAMCYIFHSIFIFHLLVSYKVGAIVISIFQMRNTRLGNFLPASWQVVQPELEPGLTPKPLTSINPFLCCCFMGPNSNVCLHEKVCQPELGLHMMDWKERKRAGLFMASNESILQNPVP